MIYGRLITQGVRASAKPSFMKTASQLMFAGYRRNISVKSTTPNEAYQILEEQRRHRPISPHLEIYKFPMSGKLSGAHRITGVVLGFATYGFLCGYLALPFVGLGFDSSSIINAFGALPVAAKIPLKFLASLPFTYHFTNGLRHMFWDFTTKNLTKAGLNKSNPIVLGVTAAASLLLTFL